MSQIRKLEFQMCEAREHLRGFGQVGRLHNIANGPVALPKCADSWVLMCALSPTRCPLKNLDHSSIASLNDNLRHIGSETFAAQNR